jgi:Flp pilus assembly protein TadG
MVEFAIAVPIYILALSCFFQLTLLIHARFMMNYAAFCAARAGVVCNAHPRSMQEAAAIALSPLFHRTRSNSMVSYGMRRIMNEFGRGRLRLSILNPLIRLRLNTARTLADLSQSEKLLRVRLEYDFPLKVPVAGRLFYEFMNPYLRRYHTRSTHYTPLTGRFFGVTPRGTDYRLPLSAEYRLRITTRERNTPL